MAEEECCDSHTIFIDTNLDTHLVMVVTDKDSVGDFKQKVLTEHPRCFPNIGEIIIHSMKVRRRGCFYHLSNSMLVKSAFIGVKKSWFVHVDAASSQSGSITRPLYLEAGPNTQPECFRVVNKISAEAGRVDVCTHQISKRVSSLNDSSVPQVESKDIVNKLLALLVPGNVSGGTMDVGNLGGKFLSNEHQESSSHGGNKRLESEAQRKADLVCEANKIPKMNTDCKKKKSRKRSRDIICDESFVQDNLGTQTNKGDKVSSEGLKTSKLKSRNSPILGFDNKYDQGRIANDNDYKAPASTLNTYLNTEMKAVNTEDTSHPLKEKEEEKATSKKRRKSKSRKDDCANQIEENASKLKSLTTPMLGFDNKDDQGIEHENVSFQLAQVVRVQEITNDMNEKAPSSSNTFLEAGIKQEVVSTKGPSLSVKEEKASSRKTRKLMSKKDSSVNQSEGPKASILKSMDIPVLGYGDKDDQVSGHEDDSLQLAQVGRVQEIRNDIDDKAPASTAKTILDAGMKQQAVNTEDPSLSIKEDKEQKKATSKKGRKSKSKRDSSVKQLSNNMPEGENDSGFRTEPLQNHQLSVNVGSLQAPSVAHESNVSGRHLANGYKEGANDYTEVPKKDGGEVNFKDYFVRKNANHEVIAPAGELVKKEVVDRKYDEELKKNKKAKKRNVQSTGATSDLEKSHDSIDIQGYKKKTQSDTPDTFQLQQSNPTPRSNLSAVFTAGEKDKKSLADHDKNEAVPHKVSRNNIVDSSEDGRSVSAVQFRSPTGVSAHFSSKVNSHRKEAGDIMNNSENRKTLLAASSTIFSESSTESSEDNFEGDNYNSDASTRTPSDTSSSSDHSEGENEVNLKSSGNGSYGQKIKENGVNSSIRPQVSAEKTMALNTILRSSRSYKKAKITASQSQPEDTGSQPIQFDLDS